VPFQTRMPPAMLGQWSYIKKFLFLRLSRLSDWVSYLNANGTFSTKSLYQYFEGNLASVHDKSIWKAITPFKIKIFLVFENVILIETI
jgi:hypothetical protein